MADSKHAVEDLNNPKHNMKEVLMIYTGGTIGMQKKKDKGLEPTPGHLMEELRKNSKLHDTKYAEQLEGKNENTLVTKEFKEGERIKYKCLEYKTLLDSSEMDMDDWGKIANDISENYEKYCGFVILHGTDTMAFGASALSFILENLGKPVVLTGSQIPIGDLRSDAQENILSSLIVAAFTNIPEVMLFFGGHVYLGNRTTKFDAGSLCPFISPNFEPLVTLNVKIKVNHHLLKRTSNNKDNQVEIFKNMSKNVRILQVFPGINGNMVEAVVKSLEEDKPGGIILHTFGTGNAPASKGFIEALKQIKDKRKNVIIVNITQCPKGAVNNSYAVGQNLKNAGVIPGGDMTTEAAFAKLSYILGKYESSDVQRRGKMIKNLRGELTENNDEDPNIY